MKGCCGRGCFGKGATSCQGDSTTYPQDPGQVSGSDQAGGQEAGRGEAG